MATTGVGLAPASSLARYLSPGPIRSAAGRQKPITSTSVSVERTRLSSRSPSSVRGRCRPGVSTMISWASGRCTMPRIARRVVCGRLLVIATLVPTSAFISVDLPTFGRPAKQAKPDRNPAAAGGGTGAGVGTGGDPPFASLSPSGGPPDEQNRQRQADQQQPGGSRSGQRSPRTTSASSAATTGSASPRVTATGAGTVIRPRVEQGGGHGGEDGPFVRHGQGAGGQQPARRARQEN